MVEDLERAQDRLDNIRTVEPLLGALRTISLGSWQAALEQRANARRYGDRRIWSCAISAPQAAPNTTRPIKPLTKSSAFTIISYPASVYSLSLAGLSRSLPSGRLPASVASSLRARHRTSVPMMPPRTNGSANWMTNHS